MKRGPVFKAFPVFLFIFVVFSYGNALADYNLNPGAGPKEWVLKPGEFQMCKKDFLIYNAGNTLAEYMITIGNETVEKRKLSVHENKFFDLHKSISELRNEGKAIVQNNDMALIFNLDKNAKVGLNCLE